MNASTKPRHRLRRRLIGLCVVAVLLGAYVLALGWFSLQIGDSVEDSLQAAPAIETPRHGAD